MPAKGVNLKITPLSITDFVSEYDISDTADVAVEYLHYLECNTEVHHYGRYKTLPMWLLEQLRTINK